MSKLPKKAVKKAPTKTTAKPAKKTAAKPAKAPKPAEKKPVTALGPKSFNVGDTVRWDSQAAGTWKTKEGVVFEAPAVGKYFKGSSRLATTRHCYAVEVVTTHSRGQRKDSYYPSTSAMALVKAARPAPRRDETLDQGTADAIDAALDQANVAADKALDSVNNLSNAMAASPAEEPEHVPTVDDASDVADPEVPEVQEERSIEELDAPAEAETPEAPDLSQVETSSTDERDVVAS